MGQTSNEYHLNRYYRIRQRIISYLGDKCTVCESTENLEVDHINPEEKSFNISKSWGRSWADIAEELKKCQLLCKNCHKVKSDTEQTTRIHGTYAMYRRGKCKCVDCKKAYNFYMQKYTTARKTCKLCKRRVTKYEVSSNNKIICLKCLSMGC